MKKKALYTNQTFLWAIILLCSCATTLSAQMDQHVYRSERSIDPEKKNQLLLEIDNITFFRNNEFAGEVMHGYSLPGFWIQPKAVYYPLENIKLELGLHALYFYGTNKYPSMAYMDIADWMGNQYQRGVHLLPWFRAHFQTSEHFHLIVGDIYGAANHGLMEPLYSPELNLTADPEMGVQILFDSRRFDFDAWLNWQSFIFKGDTHQEAFTVGLSSRLKFNDPDSRFHFYLPIQGVAQHRGGEIDTIKTNSVQTLMNGAAGLGVQWNANYGKLKNINMEIAMAGYYQQAGKLWPMDDGTGSYARISADLSDFRLKASYWRSDDFISMFGLPYYGSVSTREEGGVFDQPQLIYFGAEYARSLGKGFSLGVDLDVYYRLSDKLYTPETGWQPVSNSTSFSFGVYVRVNPSFLLKKF